MNLQLSGKRALVCGASQGIGEATAMELAQLGAQVILLARSEERLRQIQEKLPKTNHHQILSVDLSDRHLLESKVQEILKQGPIEILVNNSGGPKAGPLMQASEQDFLNGFENHVLASSKLVQLLVPGMRDKKYGRIINIISTSVKAPIANLGVSNTIRGAVANWAKSLAAELAPANITVNNVLPGYTETPRLEALANAAAERTGKTVDEIKKMWRDSTPAARFAQPQEVAAAIAFLASPSAAFITGINLPVDGGRTPSL